MRVSLVTGGGRGIGRAIAHALAGPDTCVAVAARTRSEVDATAKELAQLGVDGWAGLAEALRAQTHQLRCDLFRRDTELDVGIRLVEGQNLGVHAEPFQDGGSSSGT